MIVKCPKCGFDQPKDTYCASCGIEMEGFKPVQEAAVKRIYKSPLFSLIIFVILAYGGYLFLKDPSRFIPMAVYPELSRNNKVSDYNKPTQTPVAEDNANAMNLSTNNPTPELAMGSESNGLSADIETDDLKKLENSESTPPKSEIAAAPPPIAATNAIATSNPIAESTGTPKIEGDEETPAVTEGSEASTDKGTPPEASKGPLRLDVRFIEAPMTVVNQFLSEAAGDSAGDSGEMRFGIVKNTTKWNKNRAFIEHDRFTKKGSNVKEKIQWFSGTHDRASGYPIGIDFELSIQERSGNHIAGDFFLVRSLIDHSGAEPSTKKNEFLGHFDTELGSMIGITGVMPHTSYKSDDKDWTPDSLLKVFLSKPFLDGENELLILLQFQSDSK